MRATMGLHLPPPHTAAEPWAPLCKDFQKAHGCARDLECAYRHATPREVELEREMKSIMAAEGGDMPPVMAGSPPMGLSPMMGGAPMMGAPRMGGASMATAGGKRKMDSEVEMRGCHFEQPQWVLG